MIRKSAWWRVVFRVRDDPIGGTMIAKQAKAILAGVGAAASYLLGVLPPDVTNWAAAFGSVTVTQYIGGLVAVLGVYGIVWTVPNATTGRHEA